MDIADYHFYTPRGIGTQGKFNSSQIDLARSLGLEPEIIIGPDSLHINTLKNDFADFCRTYGLSNLEVAASVDPNFSNLNESLREIESYLKWAYDINNSKGGIIMGVNFHIGSVRGYESEVERKRGCKEDGVIVGFNATEYLVALDTMMHFYSKVDGLREKYGISILVENYPNPNYAMAASHAEKSLKYKAIDRFTADLWVPEPFQHGGFSTAREINHLVSGTGLELCVDLEHFNQTFETSRLYSAQKHPKPLAAELEALKRYGLIIKKGEPMMFERPLDIDEISQLENKISSVHIGGQVSFSFKDSDGFLHIGSHMPITPNNIFVDNPDLRKEHYTQVRSYLKEALKITHDRGCRRLTLEVHHPDYNGVEWTSMTKETLANVKEILEEI